jgi:hypothetical protein
MGLRRRSDQTLRQLTALERVSLSLRDGLLPADAGTVSVNGVALDVSIAELGDTQP